MMVRNLTGTPREASTEFLPPLAALPRQSPHIMIPFFFNEPHQHDEADKRIDAQLRLEIRQREQRAKPLRRADPRESGRMGKLS